MKNKRIKAFREIAKNIIDSVIQEEVITTNSPPKKEIQKIISKDELANEDIKILGKYIDDIRDELVKGDNIVIKKKCMYDRNSTVLEFVPLIGPLVEIQVENVLYRYYTTLIVLRKRIIMILTVVPQFDGTALLGGISLNDGEKALIKKCHSLFSHIFMKKPIFYDFSTDIRERLDNNSLWTNIDSSTENKIAEVFEQLQPPVLWFCIHLIIANAFAVLNEDEKPYYFAGLKLSSERDTVKLQKNTVRALTASLNFTHHESVRPLFPIEMQIKCANDCNKLIESKGNVVIVNSTLSSEERVLISIMQEAKMGYLAAGIAKHPLNSFPIFVGAIISADGVVSSMDWESFEYLEYETINTIREAFSMLFKDFDYLLRRFRYYYSKMCLDERKYADSYYDCWIQAITDTIFVNDENKNKVRNKNNEIIMQLESKRLSQEKRMSNALQLLIRVPERTDLIAANAKSYAEGNIGFYYDYNHVKSIAISLKNFQMLEERELGLTLPDDKTFREILKEKEIIPSMTNNVRGFERDSLPHVLLILEKCRYLKELSDNSLD